MSDAMLLGVLRMPPDLWRDTALDVGQRYDRYQQAADTIEELRDEVERLQLAFTETGFTNSELRAERLALRETCGHLSDRIGEHKRAADASARDGGQ